MTQNLIVRGKKNHQPVLFHICLEKVTGGIWTQAHQAAPGLSRCSRDTQLPGVFTLSSSILSSILVSSFVYVFLSYKATYSLRSFL